MPGVLDSLPALTATSPAGELPHLTDAWHKARKSYALFSGILIAWEFVGLELTNAPIENINVTLQAPEAAPFVFVTLVFYFGFRATIEWYQCDRRRRSLPASRLDFISSHVIAIAAVTIYVVQRLLDIQIGDYVTSDLAIRILMAILIGGGTILIFYTVREVRETVEIISNLINLFSGFFRAWMGRREKQRREDNEGMTP